MPPVIVPTACMTSRDGGLDEQPGVEQEALLAIPLEIAHCSNVPWVRPHLGPGGIGQIARQPKVIRMRVGDDDALQVRRDIAEPPKAGLQGGSRVGVQGARVDQRKGIAGASARKTLTGPTGKGVGSSMACRCSIPVSRIILGSERGLSAGPGRSI